MQILSYPGVVELTTQLLILGNILWLPLCQINKLGLNTQIYRFDTRGAKEYSQVLAVELSIQPHLDNLVSASKYLIAK